MVYLRDVDPGDAEAYALMRCDPSMMKYLGGPRPRTGMQAKVDSDVADVRAGRALICMIIAEHDGMSKVAGTVTLWSHEVDGEAISEIGWMVLPEFQGRGVAKQSIATVLERARDQHRWGVIYAFPSPDNGPSNGLCRSLGFTFLGGRTIDYQGERVRVHAWSIDPGTGPQPGGSDALVSPVTSA